jgi:hypothetical protein
VKSEAIACTRRGRSSQLDKKRIIRKIDGQGGEAKGIADPKRYIFADT